MFKYKSDNNQIEFLNLAQNYDEHKVFLSKNKKYLIISSSDGSNG